MTTTTLPPTSRFPRWAKVTLVVLAGILVPCGFALAWLVVALSGGIDDLLSGRVSGDDAQVVAAREVAERDLTAELDALTSSLPAGDPVVAHTSESDCVAGQHNWKIDDDFDLYCTHGRAALLAADGVDTFRADAIAVHDALVADGWSADSGVQLAGPVEAGIPALLQEYWDADPASDPGDLPGASYDRGSSRLVVTWVTPGSVGSIGSPCTAPAGTRPGGT